MSSTKQEERNEKIIRGLMKLPPNRRCINCNSLGPQYVCTTFWTFVCTTCSGIHREFTHRVKSVSMATFTSQEVEALQNGGNQRAIEKYLRDRDPQRKRLTDNSNAEKIRQFIKDVYVDKKYATTPKSSDKPPRDLQTIGSREEEIPRANSYHSFSQSPPYDYQYEERRYGKHAPALSRKPGSDKGLYEGKFSSFLSPTHSIDLANDMGNPFGRSSDDTIQGLPPQRTSFGSFGSLDSMSFKSESVGMVEVDSEPEQVINGGWATFDTQNVDAVNTKTSVIPPSNGNSGGDAHPLFPDSWSPFEDFAEDNLPSSTAFWQDLPGSVQSSLDTVSSQWPSLTNVSASGDSSLVSAPLNGSHQFVEDTSRAMDTQSWNAFEEPTGQLNSQNAPTSNEHVETRHPSDLYYQAEYREPEDFTVEATQKAAPSLGISSHEVEHKNPTDSKPSNPFDQTYGSDIEPTNPFEFWDMSSLDAALPNGDISTDFADDETNPWFTSGSVTPYALSGPQGASGFMAGQAGSTQITNLHAQGPVANVGGNPFA